MAFSTFSVPRAQSPLEFVPYSGPPTPERPSQRPSKLPYISERGDEDVRITTSVGVETVDVTQLTNSKSDHEVSHNLGENGEIGDDDSWGGASVPTSREDAGDEVPRQEVARQPLPIEGCGQGTALAISNSGSEADSDDPYRENAGLHLGDRLEVPSTSTTESHDEEVPVGKIDAINSETADGAKTKASRLSHRRCPSTPPTSASIIDIEQSMHEHITEKRLEREAKLRGGRSSSSSSKSDADDDEFNGKCTTSLTRKRKHLPSTNRANHKRRSQGPAGKASTNGAKNNARRWNPSPSQKNAISSRASVSRYALGTQFSGNVSGDESSEESDYQTYNFEKGPKPIANNRDDIEHSYTNDEDPAATHAPSHTNRTTRPSANQDSPVRAQWHLSGITFHSIAADISFLTALFRARSGSGVLSTSHAVNLLDNVMGASMKLDDTTIKFLASDTWFLTSRVDRLSDVAGRGADKLVSALPSLPLGKAATLSLLGNGWPSDDVGDETSSDEFDGAADESDEYSSNVVDEPSSSGKSSRWSKEEDERLRRWRDEGRPWNWICSRFSNRTPGAVKTRWHTKLREEAQQI